MRPRELHEKLTRGGEPLAEGTLGRLYQGQVRRVRELLARLEEVDPVWAAEWKRRERQDHD